LRALVKSDSEACYKKPNLCVVMATFNGDRFLNSQLESISNQNTADLYLIVNDDGSTDNTMQILSYWKMKGLIKELHTSNRIGADASFMKLLKLAKYFDYVAFSDQDDLWEPNKLYTLQSKIQGEEPTLVFCNRNYINADNEIISTRSHKIRPSFQNALIENVAPGNTMLMNKSLVDLICALPDDIVGHYDAWIYLVASGLGKCVYVPEALVNYRLHGDNLVGLRKRNLESVLDSIQKQAVLVESFAENVFGQLSEEKSQTLQEYISFLNLTKLRERFFHIRKLRVYRTTKVDNFLFRILLLAGKIHKIDKLT
jgi:glycosyltransferase involved in cell wall biosynthesis